LLSGKCLRVSDYASVAPLLLGALGMLLLCPRASALNPSFEVNQYLHRAWTHGDGFMGEIRSIVQTPDGYLWLGTEFGLVRFDGVRFSSWAPPAGQRLPSNDIMALLATRDGTLWIGTTEGLVSFRDGRLTDYPEIARQPVFAVLEDHNGAVWVGLHGGLCSIRSGEAECSEPSRLLRGVAMQSLFEDSEGRLWAAGAGSGLWQWKPGPPRKILSGSLIWPDAFAPGDLATGLRVAIDGLLRQVVGKKIEAYAIPGVRQPLARFLLRDRDDALWIGTAQGLLRVYHGKTTRFAHGDGLSSDFVSALFEDREGSIWAGTTNGIDRFREPAVATISADQGLLGQASSVLAARDGSLWIGTDRGLQRWHQGQMTVYHFPVEPKPPFHSELNSGLHEITEPELTNNEVVSLFEDRRGGIWVAGRDGAAWFENGRFTRVSGRLPVGPVNAILPGWRRGVWISYPFYGLCHVVEGRVVESSPWPWSDENEPRLSAIIPDPVKDGFWIGFKQQGIAYLAGHRIGTTSGAKYGLAGKRVWDLHIDKEGTLWAATEGGLSRIRDGRVETLTAKSGLPCDAVYWAIEDDASSLWLYTACGLVRITQPELEAWASDPKRAIHTTLFGEADGVRVHALLKPFTPVVTKSPDGKIWFVHLDGASVIDPRHLPFNKVPPPVHIERITANGKRYDPASGLRLPPQIRDLVIDYTALSLAAPEKVHFRFKLEGQDPGWREVVNQRSVEYSNLTPGNYRFRVTACNNSGVWNEAGDALEFSIDPAYYQTLWFRLTCASAFLALLWALYRLRIRQLQQQERKFREAIETIPAMAFTALPDGSRTFVNRRWVEYTGSGVEQAAGLGWQAAVHPDDVNRVLEKWPMSVATGEPLEYEARFRGADREYRWFQVRAVPLRDERGNILRWYGVMTDIEDRKRAEQLHADLAHINRVSMMGELTASLAHEIRQPIAAAITSADACLRWLTHDPPDLERARLAVARVKEDGTRAAGVISRLWSFYKKDTPPEREVVDVNDLIREMIVLLHDEATRCSVSVRPELAEGIPNVMADRVQLQQVFMNLMLNAIEAMKDTGGGLTIKSQVKQRDGQLLISISDTGVGLPAENSDQIFDAFYTTKAQGSGMGLAITRSIVESHGGRLWATANDGRGATFHLTLPAVAKASV